MKGKQKKTKEEREIKENWKRRHFPSHPSVPTSFPFPLPHCEHLLLLSLQSTLPSLLFNPFTGQPLTLLSIPFEIIFIWSSYRFTKRVFEFEFYALFCLFGVFSLSFLPVEKRLMKDSFLVGERWWLNSRIIVGTVDGRGVRSLFHLSLISLFMFKFFCLSVSRQNCVLLNLMLILMGTVRRRSLSRKIEGWELKCNDPKWGLVAIFRYLLS